jgi:excisionase family DNA binding protein
MNPERSMLTTGQVARLLGCSRQHVVDMCNAGELESTTIGTHRRIARSDVERLLPRGVRLRREEERSLWLHRALLSHLLRDPDQVMAHARANLERWRGQHREDGMSMHWLRRWERLLDAGVDGVADVLASRNPESIELRANSPFAGVLDESERLDVHRAFARHWAQTHKAA